MATKSGPQDEQLLKLYWNRADVKRELSTLKRERYELLDKLKEQEGAIVRAQEQLEGLERLLTNPVAASNAMVYFQLRHMWRVAGLKVEQFANELTTQRQNRERGQLHEAVQAKRKRRLGAINEKLNELLLKRKDVVEDGVRLGERLERLSVFARVFAGHGLKRKLKAVQENRAVLEERIDEFNDLIEKIQAEPLPDPEGLSLESRRLINLAVIALAQHLIIHFCEHDLATLSKTATERPVGDMKFGDRRTCDRMVDLIRSRINDLEADKALADCVKWRTDYLVSEARYDHETDTVPATDSMDEIVRSFEAQVVNASPMRRETDAPLRANVLADDYWDLRQILR